jgi:magnesium-protoporphyrin O-methyltransferase
MTAAEPAVQATAATDDKTIVRDYFNTTGFDRWQRIYGDGEVNTVQLDIRNGHQQTVDKVLAWLNADNNLSEISICDAGCGVGSLSIPLAQAGAQVFASDLSEKMVEEGKLRAKETLGQDNNPTFAVQDLESLTGQYHTVVCLDVLIHYPQDQAASMIAHLSSLAQNRLILSFAPKTCFYTALKRVGDFFPGPSKATRAYLHAEKDVLTVLAAQGWQLARNDMTKTRFYFSRLLEVVRQDSAQSN